MRSILILKKRYHFHDEDLLNLSIKSADYDQAMEETSPSSEPVASTSSAQLPLNNIYRPSPSRRERLNSHRARRILLLQGVSVGKTFLSFINLWF